MEDFSALRKRADKIQDQGESTRYRTLLRRIGSGTIDGAILTVPTMLFIILEKTLNFSGKYLLLMAFIQFLGLAYNIFCISKYGTTVGKFVFGLKVIAFNAEEQKVDFFRAVRRELLNSVNVIYIIFMIVLYSVEGRLHESDGMITSNFNDVFMDIWTMIAMVITISEVVTATFSAKRRAIHDLIAGTAVVKYEIKNKAIAAAAIVGALVVYYAYFQAYNVLK